MNKLRLRHLNFSASFYVFSSDLTILLEYRTLYPPPLYPPAVGVKLVGIRFVFIYLLLENKKENI